MRKSVKWIIAGAAVFIAGLVLFLVAFGLNGWKYTSNYKTDSYVCAQTISEIDVDWNAGSVKIEFYEGERVTVEYPYANGYNTKFREIRDGGRYSLDIYNSVSHWFNTGRDIPEMTVKLPMGTQIDLDVELNAGKVTVSEGAYGKIDIDVNAGTVEIADVKCTSFTGDVDAGDVNVSGLTCDRIDVDVSAGTVNLGITGAKSEYTIRKRVSVGSCNVDNQTGTASGKNLTIECSVGTVTVSFT